MIDWILHITQDSQVFGFILLMISIVLVGVVVGGKLLIAVLDRLLRHLERAPTRKKLRIIRGINEDQRK